MLKLNITKLVATVHEAPAFALPEMDDGTSYLFKNVYNRLSNDEDVRLSALDFNAFSIKNINYLDELYNNVLESNNHQAYCITKKLQRITPICKPTTYV